MSQTIAQMRAKGSPKRAETRKELCLAPHLISEVQRIQNEWQQIAAGLPSKSDDEEKDGPPRRLGQASTDPRLKPLEERLAELHAEMREESGVLILRAIDGGEWLRWRSAHPARKDNRVDEEIGYGLINAEALANDLFQFVGSFNDEPVDVDDWAYVLGAAAPGDISDIVKVVIQMHEVSIAIPKSPSASSASTTK